MHLLPVLFALVLIVVANKNNGMQADDTHEKPAVSASFGKAPALSNYVLLNPMNLGQVVTIYKMSRTVKNILR
ncbi:MAG: hypothetical protein EOO02_21900 [Chitinophagaceae bacterium]|nr:MAG: hypothetical protein EOO02_21900 [Chitinophagaceae bacterium]